MHAHACTCRYLALVIGRLEGSGIIDFPLQGKPATTLFRALKHCPSGARRAVSCCVVAAGCRRRHRSHMRHVPFAAVPRLSVSMQCCMCTRAESFGCLSWVQLWPKTGRTHQLRKHMAYLGHPVLGDAQYKHHRNSSCSVQTVPDILAHLPQLQPGQPAPPQRPQQPARRQQQQQEGQPVLEQQQHSLAQPPEPDGGAASKKQRLVNAAGEIEPAAAAAAASGDEAAAGAAGLDSDGGGSEADADGEHDDEAAGNGSSGGGARRQQLLCDGSPVSMCLWAVQLQLLHPHSRERLELEIDTPVAEYERIVSIEAPHA